MKAGGQLSPVSGTVWAMSPSPSVSLCPTPRPKNRRARAQVGRLSTPKAPVGPRGLVKPLSDSLGLEPETLHGQQADLRTLVSAAWRLSDLISHHSHRGRAYGDGLPTPTLEFLLLSAWGGAW